MNQYLFEPAEDALVAYLRSTQATEVGVDVPPERPDRFIRVERTGGAPKLAHDVVKVTFHCWAETREATAILASETMRHVLNARVVADRPVRRNRVLKGPRRPTKNGGSEHYQFTVQMEIRGRFPTP
ncbi:hypothetical protein G7068_08325 [Leucobacter viscericola]|uniref:Tail terminator n=1 Tax=Leucobacter viscericola TaxID=2714935 RepID=A0A6G7XFQ4_9MICO|nr:hypothetical protein [Leucobacter viscericola]QIK63201.1 hypothetical protein G7068_08325 [Leucobacter viscericola]